MSAMGIGKLGAASRLPWRERGSSAQSMFRSANPKSKDNYPSGQLRSALSAMKHCSGSEKRGEHLPEEVPVMPLPGAVLFPHALCSRFTFSSRATARCSSTRCNIIECFALP